MFARLKLHNAASAKSAQGAAYQLFIKVFGALAFSLAAGAVSAAGLGKLTVYSGLGQPLRAEIDLSSVSKEELDSLAVRLAPVESFRQANIEFNAILLQLRFTLDRQNESRPVIRVTSVQPVNEPFIDMLVEMNWANGRLVREYTFLLDPPELKSNVAESVAPAAVTTAADPVPASTPTPAPTSEPEAAEAPPAVKPARDARPKATPKVAAEKTVKPEPKAVASDEEIKVKAGDTLSKIALQVKPESVTLDQMLVSLYDANPQAFDGKNMNRLRAGAIIKVPVDEELNATKPADARRIVVAQTADFNAYRDKLAGAVASANTAAVKTDEGKAASGKITTKVEEKAPSKDSQDKLVLSKSGAVAGKTAKADDTAVRAAEEKIAKEKALKESESRANQLQKNVAEMQKALEAKNQAMAEAQKKAEAEKIEAEKAAAAKAEMEQVEAARAAAAKAEAEKAAAVATPVPQPEVAAAPVKPEPAVVAKTPAVPPQAPASAADFLDSLADNPTALYGGVGIVVLLLGYGLYAMQRKRRFQKFEDSIITGGDLRANSIFGSTGGQSVDTNSVFNTSFSPSQYQADTNEVDPVAEADVYIAYGREAQAEEILKEALKVQPERQAIRLKLLEIYATRNDTAAFETLAGEMYSMTNGNGEEWPKVVAMGLKLDANNPLYSGQADAANSGAAAEEPMPVAMDVEPVDFDSPTQEQPVFEQTDVEPAPAADKFAGDEALATLDFDLGLDAPQEEQVQAAPEIKLDFDLGEPAAPPPVADLDFQIEVPPVAEPATPAMAPAPLDMSGIDLNLDSGVSDAADSDHSDSWQEMTTKLDLAKAYLEIGDKEGAEELLQEVVGGGDAEQVVRAKGMLAQM